MRSTLLLAQAEHSEMLKAICTASLCTQPFALNLLSWSFPTELGFKFRFQFRFRFPTAFDGCPMLLAQAQGGRDP